MNEGGIATAVSGSREVLWVLRRGADQACIELISHGAWGWESQARIRNGLHYGQRFPDRDAAIVHAVETRDGLLAAGWSYPATPEPCGPVEDESA